MVEKAMPSHHKAAGVMGAVRGGLSRYVARLMGVVIALQKRRDLATVRPSALTGRWPRTSRSGDHAIRVFYGSNNDNCVGRELACLAAND